MRIYKYGHSCILLEKEGKRILIDPGDYAFADKASSPHECINIGAILITHSHSDHADPEAIKIILENNSGISIYGNEDTKRVLAQGGIEVRVAEGEMNIEGFHVRAVPAEHGKGVLGPLPANLAFIVDEKVLDPGDSLDPVLHQFQGIAALALPVVAPWDTRKNMAEFAVALAPKIVFPIHDGFVKDFFAEKQDKGYASFFEKKGIRYQSLRKGEFIEV